MTTTAAAEAFFYENAGYSYGPGETPEQGRRRGAVELAEAEQRLNNSPCFVSVEPDEDSDKDGPVWTVCLWTVDGRSAPQLLGSLGGVDCEEGSDYLRVVAAELALEHIR